MTYRAALALGDRLLRALQGPITDKTLDEVTRLVEERGAITQKTSELFRNGDEARVHTELQELLQQQRAIVSQMRVMGNSLKIASDELGKARSTTAGIRRILRANPTGRHVNELL